MARTRSKTSQTPTAEGPWLSTREAAAYVHLTEQYLRKLRLVGEGPPFAKLPGARGRVLYSQPALDAWVSDHYGAGA